MSKLNKYLKKQIAYNKKITDIVDEDCRKHSKQLRDLGIFWIFSDVPDIGGISFTPKYLRDVSKFNEWNFIDTTDRDGKSVVGLELEVSEATLDLLKMKDGPLDYKPLLKYKLFSASNEMKGLRRMRDIPDLE